MPNWCSNSVSITATPEKMDRLETFLKNGEGKNWFDFFMPCPQELVDVESPNRNEALAAEMQEKYGAPDWYSWSVSNWGTKWNADANNWRREGDTITFSCETAWAPPTNLYHWMFEHGWNVSASYIEEGMSFVGEYYDGQDASYELDYEDLSNIPEHLIEDFNLEQIAEEWKEMMAEDQ